MTTCLFWRHFKPFGQERRKYMKWLHIQENLKKDPWLVHVLFHRDIVREGKMPELALQQAIADCNITHVMFRGSTDKLRIDSRPVYKSLRIESSSHFVREREPGYDDFMDMLVYEINYYLVIEVNHQIVVTHLSEVPDLIEKPNVTSIRWATVNQQRNIRGSQYRWVAVVRNISIISHGEYQTNGYDVFKFPAGFNPYHAEWHVKQKTV